MGGDEIPRMLVSRVIHVVASRYQGQQTYLVCTLLMHWWYHLLICYALLHCFNTVMSA
jgi:hypothetical protein